MIYRNLLFAFLVLLLVSFSSPGQSFANQSPNLNIKTDENKVLFKLNNLKPGDIAERKLTVQNRGQKDFTYISDAKFMGGSEELYNEFLLEITDSNGLVFSGNLKDYDGFDPRLLKSLHEEDLTFIVEFPGHLGNEFQGKGFEVQIRFFVDEFYDGPDPEKPDDSEPPEQAPPADSNPQDPGSPEEGGNEPQRPIPSDNLDTKPVDGQVLPSTATNIFNHITLGIILVAFGIIILRVLQNRRVLLR